MCGPTGESVRLRRFMHDRQICWDMAIYEPPAMLMQLTSPLDPPQASGPGFDSPGIASWGACPAPGMFEVLQYLCYHLHIDFMGRHPAYPGPQSGEPSHILRAFRTLKRTV